MKITKDMTFAEILEKHPETMKVFLEMHLFCATCPMAAMETLEQGAKAHGIAVEELLKKLNDIIENDEED